MRYRSMHGHGPGSSGLTPDMASASYEDGVESAAATRAGQANCRTRRRHRANGAALDGGPCLGDPRLMVDQPLMMLYDGYRPGRRL